MNLGQAVILGVVEGLTEFLPISSTAHLLIAERLLGLPMETQEEKDALIGFTAVIQTGAIAAAVLYFFKDIVALVRSFVTGVGSSSEAGRGGLPVRPRCRSSAACRSRWSASSSRT